MTRIILSLALLLLVAGCNESAEDPKFVYLPSSLNLKENAQIKVFPGENPPPVLFDKITSLGGAYLDLITLSRSVEISGELPEPAKGLTTANQAVRIEGPVAFDWPIVIHRKELKSEDVRRAFLESDFRLLGEDGEGLRLFLPARNELVLARLLEQWSQWKKSEPSLSESALTELIHRPLAKGVEKSDISFLMKSQWENLKKNQAANVVVYEEFIELDLAPNLVAPWGLVSGVRAEDLKDVIGSLPAERQPPTGAKLSQVSQASARLFLHKIFPQRFGRRSQPGKAW